MNKFLLIASDVHSSYTAFEKLCRIAESADCLAFLYAGDLEVSDYFIANELRNRNFVFLAVRGNCDYPYEWTDTSIPYPPQVRTCTFGTASIWMSHGHIYVEPPALERYDLVITGHSHINSIIKSDGTVYLNPGSASRPRGRSSASYAIAEFSGDSLLVSTRVLDSGAVIEQCEIRLKK